METSSVVDPPLVAHARREMHLAGLFDPDADYGGELVTGSVLDVLAAVSGRGHSGGSMEITMDLVGRLARREHLAPITSDPATWAPAGTDPEPIWQSARNPAVFSRDGGRTWYHMNNPDETHVSVAP